MFIYALRDNSSTNTVHRSSSVNCISDKDHLHSVNEGGSYPSRPLSAVKLDVQSAGTDSLWEPAFSGDYLATLSDAVNLIKICQDRSVCSAAVPNMSYLTASHRDSEGRKYHFFLLPRRLLWWAGLRWGKNWDLRRWDCELWDMSAFILFCI